MVGNFSRTASFLRQYARSNNIIESKVDEVKRQLQSFISLTGEYSHSRVMLNKLGAALFQEEGRVFVPLCHTWGDRSEFGNTLSPFVQKHIDFLKAICEVAPHLKPVFLVSDTEVCDNLLLRSLGKDSTELLFAIKRERDSIQESVRPFGWQAQLVTEYISDFEDRESSARKELQDAAELRSHLTTLTLNRWRFYKKMSVVNPQEKLSRTIQVAAQYLAFGKYAKEQGALIVTHTTTNVMWYREGGAVVIHNPHT